VYRQTPLTEVVCQVRFPATLRIDTELPAVFQAQLSGDYPEFLETAEIQVLGPLGEEMQKVPQELLKEALRSMPQKNYYFKSSDGTWQVNLMRNFVAVSTTDYRDWQGFSDRARAPIAAMINTYEPRTLTQVGLRYKDTVRRSLFGLADESWSQLLQPSVVGMLAVEEAGTPVTGAMRYEFRLEHARHVVMILHVRHLKHADTGEAAILLDSDFICKEVLPAETQLVVDVMDDLHQEAWKFFEWAITPRFRAAMGPS
jgi:uncharacterized protein (TIGR04255 family)